MSEQTPPPTQTFRAHGKLLLAGEYFVLDGATAFSLPTRLGQSLDLFQNGAPELLTWQSLDQHGLPWLEVVFGLPELEIHSATNQEMAQRLQAMLLAARRQHPEFLQTTSGILAKTRLEFDRAWGLGSSSTLLHLLGQWAQVDPFAVSDATLGGSGYDIATAGATGPIWYRRKPERWVQAAPWQPEFLDQLYFVYLNQKMNSREGIRHYRSQVQMHPEWIAQADQYIQALVQAKTLSDFEQAAHAHEAFTGNALHMEPVQNRLFADYWGQTKSLGAWGGDFILATSKRSATETRSYFNERGFEVFFRYKELIVQNL